jgi:hypothetical protein
MGKTESNDVLRNNNMRRVRIFERRILRKIFGPVQNKDRILENRNEL